MKLSELDAWIALRCAVSALLAVLMACARLGITGPACADAANPAPMPPATSTAAPAAARVFLTLSLPDFEGYVTVVTEGGYNRAFAPA
ncbi:hypothetical protein Asera_22340 [Actinocatenispora sera]|uniref:Uncharacterized protein n=1 Tax=Actinocatenispora sera TaxID=390989 RepID=A0A810L0X5_9ACTN|nr:hypothetical protein Asera_22340 [Actinocatenispora sera]